MKLQHAFGVSTLDLEGEPANGMNVGNAIVLGVPGDCVVTACEIAGDRVVVKWAQP